MKRTITSVAAATMALGMLVPVAFASSTTTGLSKASQLPIVVNGSVLSNPFEMTGKDSGNTTGFFPIYYFNQALSKVGFTATWDGVNHVWAITAPGVTPTAVAGGVGTGNTSVTVNGTVVKKFNTQAAKDPAGSTVTTYLPIFYIQNVLSALGVKGTFSGQTGLSVTGGAAQNTSGAALSALAATGATSGSGTATDPAVSLNDASVTLGTTLTDANGNPLTNTAVTFQISNYGNYPNGDVPTVENASGTVLSQTQTTDAAQYTVYTDNSGKASIAITGISGSTYAYEVVATAPYSGATGGAVSSQPAYVEFVANNEGAIAPLGTTSTPYNAALNTGVPVSIILPPNAQGQAQANVTLTLTATSGTLASGTFTKNLSAQHVSFVSSSGAVLGQQIQVTTNSSGVATAYLTDAYGEAVDVSVSGLPTGVSSINDSYFSFATSGVPAKINNFSISSTTPNLGQTVYVSGQLQDAAGNPVANGQILVTAANADSNDFAYVSGTTTTSFPVLGASYNTLTTGTPATSDYGNVVTADANGSFSFGLTDPRQENENYAIYPVNNGEIAGGALSIPDTDNLVKFGNSTNLAYLSIGAFDSYVQGNNATSLPGLSATIDAGGITTGQLDTGHSPAYNTNADNGNNSQIADVFVEPQNSAGHHGGALNQAETYSISANNGGEIYSLNGVPITPASSITVQYTPTNDVNGGYYTVNGSTVQIGAFPSNGGKASVTGTLATVTTAKAGNWADAPLGTSYPITGAVGQLNVNTGNYSASPSTYQPEDFEVGLTNGNAGATTLTVSSGSIKSTANVNFNGGVPGKVTAFTPAASTISPGSTQTVTFTVEDSNGNPVGAGTATKIYYDSQSTAPLFVTQVNGSTLTSSLNLQSEGSTSQSVSTVNTPILLGSVSSLNALNPTTPINYSVSDAGVATWSNPGSSADPTKYYFTAYTDANGNISLTLQAGGLTYPTQYSTTGGTVYGNLQTDVAQATDGQSTQFWRSGGVSGYPIFIGSTADQTYAPSAMGSLIQVGTLSW